MSFIPVREQVLSGVAPALNQTLHLPLKVRQADIGDYRAQEKAPAGASHGSLLRHGELIMKTPSVDDPKPKRENLGPTGPAKVSHDEEDKDEKPPRGPSYESELEHILDKRPKTPPG